MPNEIINDINKIIIKSKNNGDISTKDISDEDLVRLFSLNGEKQLKR